jgi:hypothetical protein
MTVALGPKGNNLILGGKLSQVSAEDAYTVGHTRLVDQVFIVLTKVYRECSST